MFSACPFLHRLTHHSPKRLIAGSPPWVSRSGSAARTNFALRTRDLPVLGGGGGGPRRRRCRRGGNPALAARARGRRMVDASASNGDLSALAKLPSKDSAVLRATSYRRSSESASNDDMGCSPGMAVMTFR